jgi:uncharacterized DUF497 family protein
LTPAGRTLPLLRGARAAPALRGDIAGLRRLAQRATRVSCHSALAAHQPSATAHVRAVGSCVPCPAGRWQTIGRPSASSPVVLIVIHMAPRTQEDGEEEGRIISARKAEPSERRAYAEGQF